jgi:hypothetical protein
VPPSGRDYADPPAFRERGFCRITISTSWSGAVSRFIKRLTEKPAQLVVTKRRDLRLRYSQHFGCVCLRELPLLQHLIQRIREAQLGLTLGRVGEPRSAKMLAVPRVTGRLAGLPELRRVSHTSKYNSRRIILSMA